MVRKLLKISSNYILSGNNYTQEQQDEIEYALNVIFFELVKLLLLFIVFSFLGYIKECAIIAATTILCKPYLGGYHEDTQLKCLIASILIVGITIFLSYRTNLDLWSNCILNGFSLYCIWHQTPIINPQMPITKYSSLLRNRRTGILIVCFLISLSIVFYTFHSFADCITWSLLIQTMLMFNKNQWKNYIKETKEIPN